MTTSNSMRVKPRVSLSWRFTRTPAKLLGISRKDVARTEGANLKWVEIKDTIDKVSINFLCTQGFLTFPDKFSDDRRLFWICCEARQRDSHARLMYRWSSPIWFPSGKMPPGRRYRIGEVRCAVSLSFFSLPASATKKVYLIVIHTDKDTITTYLPSRKCL